MGSPRNESLGIPSFTEVPQGQLKSTINNSAFSRVPFGHSIKRRNHKAIGEWHGVKRTGNPAERNFPHASHLRQNLDKFVLITKKSVKFLSSVDHAKCDLLVSTQTKTCLRRQIFKSAVVLPRSTTFCEQQTKIVFLAVNLSVNSVNLKFFSASHFTFCCDFCVVHG